MMQPRPIKQLAYAAAVFVSSACALILEIVAGRLIAPYVGMSLYTWTAIIAVVLAGLSAGHWIGGRLATVDVKHRHGARRIAWSLALAALSSLASLVLIRVVSVALLQSGLDMIPVIVLLAGALFFLPSLFVGIASPILTKLAIDDRPGREGPVIGRMFAVGALGSIAGTLAAGYLFISWIGSTGTVLTVAAVYGLLALAFASSARFAHVIATAVFLPTAGLAWWGSAVSAFHSPCFMESDYFCIRIADYAAESGRASRLMVLDHLVHSINDRDQPDMLYSPYVHFVDEVTTLRMGPATVLKTFFIGGGGYTLPRAWATRTPIPEQVVAEIDPAVTASARAQMWLADQTPGLTVVHQDARTTLQRYPREPRFDIVFGDAFHDIAVPPHLVTREFHGEIAARLSARGIYVMNVIDLGVDPRFLFSLVKTLEHDFPVVEVWKTLEEIDETGRVTFVVVAATTETPVPELVSARGFVRTWRRWPAANLSRRIAQAEAPVLTDDYAPVDRLMSALLLESQR